MGGITMKEEEKQLLLADLCARLPYRVKVQTPVMNDEITLTCDDISAYFFNPDNNVFLKPFLRPMSSMTEEENQEICQFMKDYNLLPGPDRAGVFCGEIVDWLNAHHFDYRGLIEKGLAIEVTEENNPYK